MRFGDLAVLVLQQIGLVAVEDAGEAARKAGRMLLVEAMARTSEGTQLTIAGEFWADEERIRSRIRDLGLSDRIELRSRYQTDQETAELFARSDVVILPYRSATGSGVVPVAYHYDKPVIATRVGGLPEVVDDGKTGILIPADSVDALAEAINGLTRDDAAGMVPAIRAMKHGMTWTSLASTLLDAPNEDHSPVTLYRADT